jgi:iron(III) transport system substrate-binding protein
MRVVPTYRPTALLALALVTVLVSAACGGETKETGPSGALVIDGTEVADAALYAAAQQDGKFTFYATISDVRAKALIDEFKAQTGIGADIVRLSGGPMAVRVENEMKAGKLGADVIQQTDIGLVLHEKEIGAFEAYCPPGFDAIQKDSKDADCNYWAHSFTPYAIGYNTALVKEADAPKTWQALLDPKWKGKIGWAYIGAGGSNWGRDFFLRTRYGVKFWNDLSANNPLITTGSGAVTDKMATGEVAVGAVGPGTQAASAANGAPLGLVMPSDGVPVLGVYVGLAKQASKPNAAKLFLNWLASASGQKAVVEKTSDYAISPSAPAPTFNGKPMPTAANANLQYVETIPAFQTEAAAWAKEWYTIFKYSPS